MIQGRNSLSRLWSVDDGPLEVRGWGASSLCPPSHLLPMAVSCHSRCIPEQPGRRVAPPRRSVSSSTEKHLPERSTQIPRFPARKCSYPRREGRGEIPQSRHERWS